jgi:nitrite reductase/ring-hydroxylating ferredoxin subunit
MKWYPLTEEDLPKNEQEIKRLSIRGKRLCMVKLDGEYHVTSSRCPHAGADLTQGWCEAGRIICPYHRHAFDIKTGRGDSGQGNYIDTFSLKEENGQYYIGFPDNVFRRLFFFGR